MREEAIAKRYLAGRYAATPILSDHEFADAVSPLASSVER